MQRRYSRLHSIYILNGKLRVSYCEGKHLNVLLFDTISVTLLSLLSAIGRLDAEI